MTIQGDVGRSFAVVASSARRKRDLFVAHDPSLARRLDRPIEPGRDRAVLGVFSSLRIGTGLEIALGEDWFPHETWGAWAAVAHANLSLALAFDVMLPATLRLEFCALIAGTQVRRARLLSSAREVGSIEFVRPDTVVAVNIAITEADLGPGRELDLAIEVDSLVSPAAAVGGGDARLLGPGVIQVSVLTAPEDLGATLVFRRRLANILRRAVSRLRERGLTRGGLHLVRAALRRLWSD